MSTGTACRRLVAPLVLLAAAWPAAAASGDVDADVVAALGVRADVRAHAQACEAVAGPQAWQFQALESFWESGNVTAFRAADAFVGERPPAQRTALQGRIDDDASSRGRSRKALSLVSLGGADASSCHELGTQLADHDHRHDLLGPGVFQRLEAVYTTRLGSADAVRREVQREDMVVGCTKGQLRAGKRDLDALHGFCTCTIAALVSAATPAEMDAYISAQSPHQDSAAAKAELLKQPWLQKAIPKMQACTAPSQ